MVRHDDRLGSYARERATNLAEERVNSDTLHNWFASVEHDWSVRDGHPMTTIVLLEDK